MTLRQELEQILADEQLADPIVQKMQSRRRELRGAVSSRDIHRALGID
jgi:hypothetical protein